LQLKLKITSANFVQGAEREGHELALRVAKQSMAKKRRYVTVLGTEPHPEDVLKVAELLVLSFMNQLVNAAGQEQ